MDLFLGKKTIYHDQYAPNLLCPIPRIDKRREIGIQELPFQGLDVWNIHEASWLNQKGKPVVGIFEIKIDANSEFIIESKSMKLYFNSLNGTRFANADVVTQIVKQDLEKIVNSELQIKFKNLEDLRDKKTGEFQGVNLDLLDVEIAEFLPNAKILKCDFENETQEILHSNLLKSNCLVTNQPDWASVQISYVGPKIDHESLLKYLISFRNHNEFHEQCVERIFVDLMRECRPAKLSVHARYVRRGGIDINPFRTNFEDFSNFPNFKMARQ